MLSLRKYLCILICLMTIFSWSQEVHHISLRIDTKNATPEKSIQWVVGQNSHVLNTGREGTFTVLASVGDHILWEAVSMSEPKVPVYIDRLKYVKGPRIFSRDVIPGDEDMQATVIRGGKEDYVYNLIIRIGDSEHEHITSSCIRIID